MYILMYMLGGGGGETVDGVVSGFRFCNVSLGREIHKVGGRAPRARGYFSRRRSVRRVGTVSCAINEKNYYEVNVVES